MNSKIRIKPLILGIALTVVFWKVLGWFVLPPNTDSIYKFEYNYQYFSVRISATGDSLRIAQQFQDLSPWFESFQEKYRSGGVLDQKIFNAQTNDTIALDSLAYSLFSFALKFREFSQGDIDVGIGNLLRAWKDAGAKDSTLSDSVRQALVAELATLFYSMDSASQSLVVLKSGRHFALGAFMEGLLLDEVARRLKVAQSPSWLVDVSGDFAFQGVKPNGEPWTLGVRDPNESDELLAKVQMDSTKHSFCTSGDYEQKYTDKSGKKHHHIINPRTGESSQGIRSASVAQSIPGMNKNTLCTWFMMLPLARIQEEVRKSQGQIEALIVLDSNRIWMSNAMAKRTQILRDGYEVMSEF